MSNSTATPTAAAYNKFWSEVEDLNNMKTDAQPSCFVCHNGNAMLETGSARGVYWTCRDCGASILEKKPQPKANPAFIDSSQQPMPVDQPQKKAGGPPPANVIAASRRQTALANLTSLLDDRAGLKAARAAIPAHLTGDLNHPAYLAACYLDNAIKDISHKITQGEKEVAK